MLWQVNALACERSRFTASVASGDVAKCRQLCGAAAQAVATAVPFREAARPMVRMIVARIIVIFPTAYCLARALDG